MKLCDAHNHFQDFGGHPELPRILADLAEIELGAAIVNGTAEDDWAQVGEVAKKYPFVIPSFGLHPWHVGNRSPDALQILRAKLVTNPEAMIGETGLDKWMLERVRPDDWRLRGLRLAPMADQAEILRAELALAVELDRPITVHCVLAWGPLLEILRSLTLPRRGLLFHAYSGSIELIPELTEFGGYFSFNGRFLESRHRERQEVFRRVPTERLLVETDAPAMLAAEEFTDFSLAPDAEGHRLNHPANLRATYRGLAKLLGQDLAKLTHCVEENFRRFTGRKF